MGKAMHTMAAALAGGALALLPAIAAAGESPGTIKVTSSAFDDRGRIPAQYTCEGKGVAPPISWTAPPAGTKSVAVVVADPDAPNGTFDHLVAFNLPPDRRSLPTEAVKSIAPGSALVTARNSNGTIGFSPICPPSGSHHYKFEVMALDQTLPLHAGADAHAVQSAMQGHVLARGQLVGVFGKR